ncbi:MAG TPA: glutamyl-tRNA reductase [Eubacteriaceae bacterium]|nr:glutamyl-tRNA reductase [Eubacteriaceae bacterium]
MDRNREFASVSTLKWESFLKGNSLFLLDIFKRQMSEDKRSYRAKQANIGVKRMKICVVGINHHSAPVEIREKAAFTSSAKETYAKVLLDQGVRELVILSTCNRSEVYMVAEESVPLGKIGGKLYQEKTGESQITPFLFEKSEDEAVAHAYEVASGFDSVVIGEDQILGQTKEALAFAQELGTSGKILNKLFREAITYSKKIRGRYKLSENPVSTCYVGLKLVQKKVQSLKDKTVLIIGLGNIGKLALEYILEHRPKKIIITNRTHDKVLKIGKELKKTSDIPVEIIYYEKRYQALEKADVLISATGSPHKIFTEEKMQPRQRPLVVLDLALPRDVDEGVKDRGEVTLYDVDDLKNVIDENLTRRKEIRDFCRKEICEESLRLIRWKEKTKLDPVLSFFQKKSRQIHGQWLESVKSEVDLSEKEMEKLQQILNRCLKDSLTQPVIRLKSSETKDAETIREFSDLIQTLESKE